MEEKIIDAKITSLPLMVKKVLLEINEEIDFLKETSGFGTIEIKILEKKVRSISGTKEKISVEWKKNKV